MCYDATNSVTAYAGTGGSGARPPGRHGIGEVIFATKRKIGAKNGIIIFTNG